MQGHGGGGSQPHATTRQQLHVLSLLVCKVGEHTTSETALKFQEQNQTATWQHTGPPTRLDEGEPSAEAPVPLRVLADPVT